MNRIKHLIACAALAAALPASADSLYSVVGLGFENILTKDGNDVFVNANILEFYNGGASATGTIGPDYNVSFAAGAQAIRSIETGGTGSMKNLPSGNSAMFFEGPGEAILNFADGFNVGFSFAYANQAPNATVTLYRGLDGTGEELGSELLGITVLCPGNGAFCNWNVGAIDFAGMAKSAVFRGMSAQVLFDDVTFGALDPTDVSVRLPTPPPAIPEPSTYALMALGLAGMGLVARRRRSAA